MSVMFHPLRVRTIEPATQEAVIVSFDVPPDLPQKNKKPISWLVVF